MLALDCEMVSLSIPVWFKMLFLSFINEVLNDDKLIRFLSVQGSKFLCLWKYVHIVLLSILVEYLFTRVRLNFKSHKSQCEMVIM